METADPTRMYRRRERADPRKLLSSTEQLLASFKIPYTLKAEPHRTKPRNERVLPKSTCSKMLIEDPNLK
jgi:hypothetical protein